MMQDINAELRQLEQRERLERLRVNREKSSRKKRNDRRCFIVGEIFLEIFPEFLRLQPQLTAQDNEREFRVVRDFLSAVAAGRKAPLHLIADKKAHL